MRKQPLLILLVCFILGILFQENFSVPQKLVYIFVIISFLTLILFFVKNLFFQKLKYYFLGIFFFALGIFSHQFNFNQPENLSFQKKENLVFKLAKKLNSNEKSKRYEVKAWKNGTSFETILSIPKSEKDLDFKHYYKGEVYINKVEKPNNDFQFDYQKYLSRQGIFYQSYLPNQLQISERNDLTFTEKIKQKRLEILQNIDQSTISSKNREFLKGIILADRTEIDSETVSDFNKTGLVHVLAISGSHMVIIFWLILFVLKPIFSRKNQIFPILISLAAIWIFAIFIDYGNSVVRSCIMISAYYFYVLLQRKPDLLHAMALSGFIILLYDTNQIFDVGFLLSFVAVFGIFWLNQPILKLFPKNRSKIYQFFTALFSLTLSAQISTLPLVLYYFHQFSLISILANLIIIPFSEIIIIFSLVMTFVIGFGYHFSWLNSFYDWFIEMVLKSIHWFAGFDVLFSKNIAMSFAEVVVLFVAIYFLRNLVLKFNSKNLLNFSIPVLVFFALRIGLNFYWYQKDEVLVHQYFKKKIISVKENDKVFFWIDENSDKEKIEKYIVSPYVTSRRTKNFEINYLPKSSKSIVYKAVNYSLE